MSILTAGFTESLACYAVVSVTDIRYGVTFDVVYQVVLAIIQWVVC